MTAWASCRSWIVCVFATAEDFHPGGFRAADTGIESSITRQDPSGDGLFSALLIQRVEGMEKGLRIGLSTGHVFCAGDVKKFFSKPCVVKDHFDLMAERAGRDGQGVGCGGFAQTRAPPGKWSDDRSLTLNRHGLFVSSVVRGRPGP